MQNDVRAVRGFAAPPHAADDFRHRHFRSSPGEAIVDKKRFVLVLVACMMVVMAGCAANPPNPNPTGVTLRFSAPAPNPLANTPDADGRVAGIWPGIWHGIISPVTLVLSFLNTDAEMYEVHNNGSQYDLGFLLGVALVFGILGLTAGSRRRRG